VDDFTRFAREIEPRMRYALVAALGYDRGREATQDALVYAWEHWDRIRATDNPAGYLYRVAKRRALRRRKRPVPIVDQLREPDPPEPALEGALRSLSPKQRAAVYLIEAAGLTFQETADLLHVSRASVQTHRRRGMARLRKRLGVTSDA
jgi:RNA polymerase sigma-70 factor (ECF subfamily)